MLKIDTHQHFWLFDPVKDGWITDDMFVLQKNFLPQDIEPIMQHNDIAGCIAVQADQSEQETLFLLQLAKEHPCMLGVVGWADLKAGDINERLAYFKQFERLKGFRHILQAEDDVAFMLNEEFQRGIAALTRHGFTYDLLIKPQHLKAAGELAAAHPAQRFVVDHLAKPAIRDKQVQPWKDDLFRLAEHGNVYCKISGMLTEADWDKWEPSNFTAYLDVAFDSFGTNRVMFGSDWPVCTLAGGYKQFIDLLELYMAQFTPPEQASFWGLNALKFYNIQSNLYTT